MKKNIFNLLWLLLLISLAGFLPGMESPLPLIGITPIGGLSLGLVLWAVWDLFLAPILDGIEVKDDDGRQELTYTIKGRKAMVVQLVGGLWRRAFPSKGDAAPPKKAKYEKKIKLS